MMSFASELISVEWNVLCIHVHTSQPHTCLTPKLMHQIKLVICSQLDWTCGGLAHLIFHGQALGQQ